MFNLVIVEDEKTILDGLVYLFPWSNLDFRIAGHFTDSVEALEYVRGNPVDALLTDIMMPRLTGLDMVRMLLAEKPELQVVFLTGHRNFSFAHEALRMHAFSYLLKPVKHEDLIATFLDIREVLARRQAPKDGAGTVRGNEKIVNQVQLYVAQNLKTATLEGAAVAVNLSAGYLSRLFRETTGVNFIDYCGQQRMERAAHLLLCSDLRTYEISDEIGYDNPKNFTRAFRKYYGVSPRDYRNGTVRNEGGEGR